MLRALCLFMLFLMLSGCGLWKSEMTIPEKVAAVREKAVELCGYLPKADSVEHMLLASNPVSQTVEAVANAICNAVVAWQKQHGAAPSVSALTDDCPRVNGVCVEGEFVDVPKGDSDGKQ